MQRLLKPSCLPIPPQTQIKRRRDLNPQPSESKSDVPPVELLLYKEERTGFEPATRLRATVFKTA